MSLGKTHRKGEVVESVNDRARASAAFVTRVPALGVIGSGMRMIM